MTTTEAEAITRQESVTADEDIAERQAAYDGCELLAGLVTVRSVVSQDEKLPFAYRPPFKPNVDPEESLMLRSLVRGEQ